MGRKYSLADRCNGLRAFGLLLVLMIGFTGCQSTGSDNGAERNGGREDTETTGNYDKKELRMMESELRQVRTSVAELMQKFSSDRPRVWKKTARELQNLGADFLPDIFMERVERATERGPEGKKARRQLAWWGTLKSIVLKLPSRDPETWDEVRRKMLKEGENGKEMFIMHMLDFLKTPELNRKRAAEQLAKVGPSVVNEAWSKMNQLARNARRAAAQGKTIKGAMIVMQGLAQVQVHAGRWQRIRSALQHDSIRIRMAMAQALGQAEQVSRASKLLGHVVRQDPRYRVRNAAVKALGVFDRRKEPIEPLTDALKDSNEVVAQSSAEALKYFHKHEQTVVRAMINVLGEIQNRSDRKTNRRILHKALQEITDASSVGQSYRKWAAWYRMEYNRQR